MNTFAPKISIIIPVYNVEQYLRASLDSAVNQTLREIEFICIDDGATDSCPKILDEYAAKDSRFVIIHQKNAGVPAARNAGMKVARGEYIAFLDSDDLLDPTMCEKSFARAKESDADVVLFFFNWFDGENNKNFRFDLVPRGEITDKMRCWDAREYCGTVIWNQIYRREFIEKNQIYFIPGIFFDDVPFGLKSACFANKYAVLPEALYEYRLGCGITTNPKMFYRRIFIPQTFNAMYEDFCTSGLSEPFLNRAMQTKWIQTFVAYYHWVARSDRRKFRQEICRRVLPGELELLKSGKIPLYPMEKAFFLSLYGTFLERQIARLKVLKYRLADALVRRLIPHSHLLQTTMNSERK